MRLVKFESESFEIRVGIELPEAEEVVDLGCNGSQGSLNHARNIGQYPNISRPHC